MIFRVQLILALVALAGGGLFIWHYQSTIKENKRLRVEISAANNTIKMLDKKIEIETEISADTNQIIREVRDAPEKDDGPVAPVLRRAIDRLHNNSE